MLVGLARVKGAAAPPAPTGLSAPGAAVKGVALALAGLFAAALVPRLWLLGAHWLNADEGAHLMDGEFAREGLVPQVDYGSRQVVYVHAIALFLRLFGADYARARLLPLLAVLLTAVLVFLIGRELFGRRVGFLACAVYLFLPFSVAYSTQVKTQPLAALLGSAGVWLLLLGVRRGYGKWLLAASGAMLALGFHVRESTLALAAALLLFLIFHRRAEPGRMVREAGAWVAGYALICLLILAAYAERLGAVAVWDPALSPLGFLRENLAWLGGLAGTPQGEGIAASAPLPAAAIPPVARSDQPWAETVSNLGEALYLNAFLLAAAVLAPVVIRRAARGRQGEGHGLLLLYLWIGALGLTYGYWALRRGFFPAYLVELLPPLSIVFALVLPRILPSRWGTYRELGAVAGVLTLLYLARLAGLPSLHRPLYFSLTALLLAAAFFAPRPGAVRWGMALAGVGAATAFVLVTAPRLGAGGRMVVYLGLAVLVYGSLLVALRGGEGRGRAAGFVLSSFLLFPLVLAIDASAGRVDQRWDGSWSPERVRMVSDLIRDHSVPGDEVMSGAVIWAFQAGRRPFMDETHPLGYLDGIDRWDRERITRHFGERPPAFVVLDGFTERTFLAHVPGIEGRLADWYVPVLELRGPGNPVRVYQLDRSLRSVSAPPAEEMEALEELHLQP